MRVPSGPSGRSLSSVARVGRRSVNRSRCLRRYVLYGDDERLATPDGGHSWITYEYKANQKRIGLKKMKLDEHLFLGILINGRIWGNVQGTGERERGGVGARDVKVKKSMTKHLRAKICSWIRLSWMIDRKSVV